MVIYYWLLFFSVLLFTAIPTLIFLAQVSDEQGEAGSSSYLPILTCILSGLIPIVGVQVVSETTVSIVWKIVLLMNLLIGLVYCIRYGIRYKHFIVSFLFTLIVSVSPFFVLGDNMSLPHSSLSDLSQYFDIQFPYSLIFLGAVLLIFGILIGYCLAPPKNKIITSFSGTNGPVMTIRDYEITQDLSNMMKEQEKNLKSQIKTIDALVEQIQMQALLAKYPSNESRIDSRVGALLSRLVDDVAILKSHASQYEVNEINVDQETLVRELTHFIATPLATIDASCKALQSMPLKGKEQAKLSNNFERILSAVNICNGILSTYREIFAGSKIDGVQRLSALVRSSFDVYNSTTGKKLKLKLQVNDNHQNISNYYIMSMILPIISNAVSAAKPNSTIEVIETGGIIRVSNTFVGEIKVSNFEIEGYSSKGDGHRGMGLFTVRHLLARRKLGNMNYYLKDNRIYFEIPINVANDEQTRKS